jgi:hypothetical protein
MFFGHDHLNLVDHVWGGVHWVYALKTGKCHYHADDRIGGTFVTMGQDREVIVDRVFETDVPEVPAVRHVKQFLESHARSRPRVGAIERGMEKGTQFTADLVSSARYIYVGNTLDGVCSSKQRSRCI